MPEGTNMSDGFAELEKAAKEIIAKKRLFILIFEGSETNQFLTDIVSNL